ncbi:MAG: hypothetical protein IJS28_04720 [Synergistaceae bacterium]|nr:hypothetical protein [Synergistaceae bacterium]
MLDMIITGGLLSLVCHSLSMCVLVSFLKGCKSPCQLIEAEVAGMDVYGMLDRRKK